MPEGRDEVVRIVALGVALVRKSASQSALERSAWKRVLMYVAGAFIEFALCWSIVDCAKSAGLDETIDLSSFRLGLNFCIIL